MRRFFYNVFKYVSTFLLVLSVIVVGGFLLIWFNISDGAGLRRAVQAGMIIDPRGEAVDLSGYPIDAIPDRILEDLAEAEGQGALSLAAGVVRRLRDEEGSAPIAFQVWKMLHEDGYETSDWAGLIGTVGALKLQWSVDQRELVEFYARKAPFVLDGPTGIAFASRSRFGVAPEDLSREQGLAIIACAPSPANCKDQPDERRRAAFRVMVNEAIREGRVAPSEVDPDSMPRFLDPEARTASRTTNGIGLAAREVRRRAAEILPNNYDSRRATISTSIRFDWTRKANEVLDDVVESLSGERFANVILTDPEGRVVLYTVRGTSGDRILDIPFDALRSSASRSASRWKPVAYTYAADRMLEQLSPERVLAYEMSNVHVREINGTTQEVRGCGGVEMTTFAESLKRSCNGSSLNLLASITPAVFADFVADLGVELQPTNDMILGSQSASAFAMTEIYHTLFANEGVRAGLTMVDRLSEGDSVLFDVGQWARPGIRVVRAPATELVRQALTATVEVGGTAHSIRSQFPELSRFDFAIKTGTTEPGSPYKVLGVSGVFRPPGHDWWTVTLQVEGRGIPSGWNAGSVAAPVLGELLTELHQAGAWTRPRGADVRSALVANRRP